jgi:HlyD family secretion protein
MAKKKKNTTRRVLILLGVLVLLVVVIGTVVTTTDLIGPSDRTTEVEIATVEIRKVTQVVTASGKVQPEIEVKISPDVPGEIIALPVREGDRVTKGMLLVSIKPDFYIAQADQAKASVLQAKAGAAQRRADLLNAELEEKRQRKLYEARAISESDYLTAKTRYETSKAGFESAQYSVQIAEARLDESEDQLSKTNIYSPMDGTVSILNVELGERVVGTSQFTGTEMLRIAELERMELEVDVNENDVVNVVLGDSASIEVDAYPERTFRGVVTEIANSARIQGAGSQEQVTNFPVKIRILDRHNTEFTGTGTRDVVANNEVPVESSETPSFRPGMSGTVDIFTKTLNSAISIPIQAVTVRDFNKLRKERIAKERRENRRAGAKTDADSLASGDDENVIDEEDLRRVVFLMEDGIAKMVEVETGISDDTHIVVTSGVSEGETVITGPYRAVSRTLKPDDKVKKREEKKERDSGSDD